jgi:hypothetical protein
MKSSIYLIKNAVLRGLLTNRWWESHKDFMLEYASDAHISNLKYTPLLNMGSNIGHRRIKK